MNRKIIILLYLLVSTLFLACTKIDNTSINNLNSKNKNDINYTIEQIYFSKAFQSTTPNVEAKDINGKKTLALNLGLSQYSEVRIDNMKLEGNECNIYISGDNDKLESSLSVPQITLTLDNSQLENIKDMDFNIVYNDYEYIDIKFKINDVLNKLESQFGLSLNSCPSFNLVKKDEQIIWQIIYDNIISSESEDYTLINLKAEVDANTGEVLNYDKEEVSSAIDTGTILNFNDNGLLLYEKISNSKSDDENCELWIYDTKSKEKKMIYNYHSSIVSAEISDDLSNIAFIEKNEVSYNVYIYSIIDSKIYKLQFEEFHPQVLKWKEDKTLYLLENKENGSTIYSYEVETNQIKQVANTNKKLDNIITGQNGFIVTEKTKDSISTNLLFTNDFNKYINISEGFNPKFIDNEIIGYLKTDESTDMSYLILYNLEENKIINSIKENIVNFKVSSLNNIVYVKNNLKYKDYTLSNYSLTTDETTDLINIIDKDIYYNSQENLIYINVELPFENDDLNIIHSIHLK